MKFTRPGTGLTALCLALTLAAGPAAAQPGGAQPSPEQMKAIQAWTGSLAVQAATYAAPIVAMYNLRAAVAFGAHPKAPPNEIWRLEDISTPEIAAQSGYVSPNVDVVYGFGFADLQAEPIILSAPDSGGLYYMIQIVDMWTNAFAYPAGKTAGYKGGKFALVGPGWKGQLPPGVQRIDCPTRWVLLQPRVHVPNEAGLARARQVLQQITLQGLSQFRGGPAPRQPAYDYEVPRLDPKVASSHFPFDDPLQFWSVFSAALNENPPPASQIQALLPQFKYLGIELGKPWTPQSVNPLVLAQMKQVAHNIAPLVLGTMSLGGLVTQGWLIPPPNTGMSGTDYLERADVAVFGLTANTPTEAIYYPALLDANGQALTGQKRYTVTFKEPMQFAKPVAPGFWSVTMYDKATGFSVPNPIKRYSLGSDSELQKNADGSFTLYLQTTSPGADKQANWLPTPPGPFYLILRNYAPVPQAVAQLNDPATFQGPPALMPVDAQ